jgi:hypothetical protein
VAQTVEVLQLEYLHGQVPDARVMLQEFDVPVEMAVDPKLKVRVAVDEPGKLLVISFRQGVRKLHPAAFRTGRPQLVGRDRRPHVSKEWRVSHGVLSERRSGD